MDNRRKHVRHQLAIAAEITIGDDTLTAETRDVSEGGVSVVLGAPIPDGTQVELSLILTQDGIEDPREEPFETKASVMWSAAMEQDAAGGQSAPVMHGLRFATVSTDQRQRLARFLAAIADSERS
jgi:c-di-GMP-binding flagellar brake protein YcgR